MINAVNAQFSRFVEFAERLPTSQTGRMSTSTGFSRRSSAEKGEER